jgi:threonine/homoserine/homoserine lactone efflux protein
MFLLLSCLTTIGGVFFLHQAWTSGRNERRQRQWICRCLALAFFFASIGLWQAYLGFDRGIIIAFLALSLVPFSYFTWQQTQQYGAVLKTSKEKQKEALIKEPKQWLRRTWIVLLAGPFSLILAIVLSIFVFATLTAVQWHPANVLATVLILCPILWAALIVWSTTSVSLKWRSASVLVSTVLGFGGVWLLMGG